MRYVPWLPLVVTSWTSLLRFTECFIKAPNRAATRRWVPSGHPASPHGNDNSDNSNEDEAQKKRQNNNLDWLRDAMSIPSPIKPDGLAVVKAQPGIAGFAIDPERGFVVVLVGGSSSSNDDTVGADRATYAIISPKDKQQLQSPEALTLVQLAGGLDLGTPVLPPDILARLVADKIRGENSSPANYTAVRELRGMVKLRHVDVVPYDGPRLENDDETKVPSSAATIVSTPERDAIIEEQCANVTAAVKKLPGLQDCCARQVQEALQMHANEEGKLERQGFTFLLDTLRRQLDHMEAPKVQFNLWVDVAEDDVDLLSVPLCITAPTNMIGVGLVLRYKVPVAVSEECLVQDVGGFDVVEIANRFPAFRPIQELDEDARIMDAFIPSLFTDATTAPKNDDKA